MQRFGEGAVRLALALLISAASLAKGRDRGVYRFLPNAAASASLIALLPLAALSRGGLRF